MRGGRIQQREPGLEVKEISAQQFACEFGPEFEWLQRDVQVGQGLSLGDEMPQDFSDGLPQIACGG